MGKIITLTEIIFLTDVAKVNWDFLHILLFRSKRVMFNYPEEERYDYSFIVSVLNNCDYVDIAFKSVTLNFIPHVFVNLVLCNNQVELLFFLDIKDFNFESYKESIDYLIEWAESFRLLFGFDSFICRPDCAHDGDFYYQNGDYGHLYRELS